MKNQSNPEAPAALAPDSEVTNTALNDLGWRNGDAQAFAQQRDYLAQNAGIKGLALVAVNEVEKARDLFYPGWLCGGARCPCTGTTGIYASRLRPHNS